jgi:hypothetical protein
MDSDTITRNQKKVAVTPEEINAFAGVGIRNWVIFSNDLPQLKDANNTLLCYPKFLAEMAKMPTKDDLYDIIARQFLSNSKTKDHDKHIPRRQRISAIIQELMTPGTPMPAAWSSKGDKAAEATWKHHVSKEWRAYNVDQVQEYRKEGSSARRFYRAAGLSKEMTDKEKEKFFRSWANSGRSGPPTQQKATPLEDAFKILVEAHFNAPEGKHHGRDATFFNVQFYHSSAIIKDIVVDFVNKCPGCQQRLATSREAHDKRSKSTKRKIEEITADDGEDDELTLPPKPKRTRRRAPQASHTPEPQQVPQAKAHSSPAEPSNQAYYGQQLAYSGPRNVSQAPAHSLPAETSNQAGYGQQLAYSGPQNASQAQAHSFQAETSNQPNDTQQLLNSASAYPGLFLSGTDVDIPNPLLANHLGHMEQSGQHMVLDHCNLYIINFLNSMGQVGNYDQLGSFDPQLAQHVKNLVQNAQYQLLDCQVVNFFEGLAQLDEYLPSEQYPPLANDAEYIGIPDLAYSEPLWEDLTPEQGDELLDQWGNEYPLPNQSQPVSDSTTVQVHESQAEPANQIGDIDENIDPQLLENYGDLDKVQVGEHKSQDTDLPVNPEIQDANTENSTPTIATATDFSTDNSDIQNCSKEVQKANSENGIPQLGDHIVGDRKYVNGVEQRGIIVRPGMLSLPTLAETALPVVLAGEQRFLAPDSTGSLQN